MYLQRDTFDTLNAVVINSENPIITKQEDGAFSSVKLLASTQKIGKVDTIEPDWSAINYSSIAITVPANTVSGTWINGEYLQEYHNIKLLKLIPIVTTAASSSGTTIKLRMRWGDGSSENQCYMTQQVTGTPANGDAEIQSYRKFWTLPVGTAKSLIDYPIIVAPEGIWLQIEATPSTTSASQIKVRFNATYK